MNRRSFLRGLLVSFAASTALARVAVELVDDEPEPTMFVNINGEDYGVTDWTGGTITLDRPVRWDHGGHSTVYVADSRWILPPS